MESHAPDTSGLIFGGFFFLMMQATPGTRHREVTQMQRIKAGEGMGGIIRCQVLSLSVIDHRGWWTATDCTVRILWSGKPCAIFLPCYVVNRSQSLFLFPLFRHVRASS